MQTNPGGGFPGLVRPGKLALRLRNREVMEEFFTGMHLGSGNFWKADTVCKGVLCFSFYALPSPFLLCWCKGRETGREREETSCYLSSTPSSHSHHFTVSDHRYVTLRWSYCFSVKKLNSLGEKNATLNVYGIPSCNWGVHRTTIFLTPWPSSLYLDWYASGSF